MSMTPMAHTLQKISAQSRTLLGSREARRLRRAGRTPATLEGGGEATVSLSLETHAFLRLVHDRVRVLDLDLDGQGSTAQVSAVQWDPLGEAIHHVSLGRVRAGEKVHVTLPFEFVGSPKGLAQGGTLLRLLHECDVRCEVAAVPVFIEVAVGHLELNGEVHLKDIALPEGVEWDEEMNPEQTVASVVPVHIEEVAPVTPVAGEGAEAEPELIGKKKEDEEEKEKEDDEK